MRTRPVMLAAAATLALLAAAVAPVAATIHHREAYAASDSWSWYDCGPTIDVDATFSGRLTIRAGKGDNASAFFVHDRFEYREVHTRRSDGKVAIVTGHANLNETTARHVDGTVYRFEIVYAGQPFTVHDADGNLLLRDRGSIRITILFDTLGDDIVGGELVEFLGEQVNGPHPGFTTDAFCDYWTADLP